MLLVDPPQFPIASVDCRTNHSLISVSLLVFPSRTHRRRSHGVAPHQPTRWKAKSAPCPHRSNPEAGSPLVCETGRRSRSASPSERNPRRTNATVKVQLQLRLRCVAANVARSHEAHTELFSIEFVLSVRCVFVPCVGLARLRRKTNEHFTFLLRATQHSRGFGAV